MSACLRGKEVGVRRGAFQLPQLSWGDVCGGEKANRGERLEYSAFKVSVGCRVIFNMPTSSDTPVIQC